MVDEDVDRCTAASTIVPACPQGDWRQQLEREAGTGWEWSPVGSRRGDMARPAAIARGGAYSEMPLHFLLQWREPHTGCKDDAFCLKSQVPAALESVCSNLALAGQGGGNTGDMGRAMARNRPLEVKREYPLDGGRSADRSGRGRGQGGRARAPSGLAEASGGQLSDDSLASSSRTQDDDQGVGAKTTVSYGRGNAIPMGSSQGEEDEEDREVAVRNQPQSISVFLPHSQQMDLIYSASFFFESKSTPCPCSILTAVLSSPQEILKP